MLRFVNLLIKMKPFFIGITLGSLFLIDVENVKLKIVILCFLGCYLILLNCISSFINKKITNISEIIMGVFFIFLSISQQIVYLKYLLLVLVMGQIFFVIKNRET